MAQDSNKADFPRHRREELLRRARLTHLSEGEFAHLRELLAHESDLLVLSRLTRAATPDVRGVALLRLSAVEPMRADRHLAVFRHCMEMHDRGSAQQALDVAEAVAPTDRRVLWARLEWAEGLPADEVLALVVCYEQRFAGDPILAMVRERCRRLLRVQDESTATEVVSAEGEETREEPIVVLDPVAAPVPARTTHSHGHSPRPTSREPADAN